MPSCPRSASLAYLVSRKRAIMFHHATHRCFLWACNAMCAWQGCPSLHFNTKHFVLVLITRQAKADWPCFLLPLWVTVIDNQPCLAIIRLQQSINHFQRKHYRERSFEWARFYPDNCSYVQQISPKISRCLHSMKWKRLPFLWLTVGILQIWRFVFIAAVVNGHRGWHPLQDGSLILQIWCVWVWMCVTARGLN